jgi:hypothetical protein
MCVFEGLLCHTLHVGGRALGLAVEATAGQAAADHWREMREIPADAGRDKTRAVLPLRPALMCIGNLGGRRPSVTAPPSSRRNSIAVHDGTRVAVGVAAPLPVPRPVHVAAVRYSPPPPPEQPAPALFQSTPHPTAVRFSYLGSSAAEVWTAQTGFPRGSLALGA